MLCSWFDRETMRQEGDGDGGGEDDAADLAFLLDGKCR